MSGKKQFDQQEALQLAMRAFWERGYAATSVSDLQAAMGIGRASLYATFGDKENLFLSALRSYVDAYGPPVREAFRIHSGDSLEALKATFAASMHRMADAELPRGCLIAQSASELGALGSQSQAFVKDLVNAQLLAIRTAFVADVGRRQFKADTDVEALAIYVTSAIHSLSIMHRIGVGLPAIQRSIDFTLASLQSARVGSERI